LRERAEPTQVEHLSDASLEGRPLALPTSIILGWKSLPGQTLWFVTKSVKRFVKLAPGLVQSTKICCCHSFRTWKWIAKDHSKKGDSGRFEKIRAKN